MPQRILRDDIEVTIESPSIVFRDGTGAQVAQIKNGVGSGWAALVGGFVNVLDYGAVGDGVADDTAAIQAAINVVAAAGRGVVFLPPGIYLITSALTVNTKFVTVRGAGWGATRITHSYDGDTFIVTAPVTGNTEHYFCDFEVIRSGTPTTGAVFSLGAVGNGIFERLHFTNVYGIWRHGNGVGFSDSSNTVYINDVVGTIVDGGYVNSVFSGVGGGIYLDNVQITGGPSHTSSYGFRADGAVLIDVFSLHDCYYEQLAYGVALTPSGAAKGISDFFMSDCIFDNSLNTSLLIAPTSSASVARGRISRCWFDGHINDLNINPSGGGTVKDIVFGDGNEFLGKPCLVQGGSEIWFDGVDMYDGVTSGTRLAFSAGLSRFGVRNSRIGAKYRDIATSSVGISIAANCSDYQIVDNDLSKNTTGMTVDATSLISTGVIRDNLGYNGREDSTQFNGALAPPQGPMGATTGAVAASSVYFVRFVPTRSFTASKITFAVSVAAGSNDNVDVGILDFTLSTVLASSGSTAGKLNATGNQTVSFTSTVTLVAGTVYYAAIGIGTIGTTAAQLVTMNLGLNTTPFFFGNSAPAVLAGRSASTFPIATPITQGGTAAFPVLAILP